MQIHLVWAISYANGNPHDDVYEPVGNVGVWR